MTGFNNPSFTFGIEEEYLLVDLETRDLASDPPDDFMACCKAELGEHVSPEFFRCQVEIGTAVCSDPAEARRQLAQYRRAIATCAARFGLAPIAASTHPFAEWTEQVHTARDRYRDLANIMQIVGRRMLICGMHVHVAVEDEALRFDLFDQIPYFLPHLLALSTSSPFWRSDETGLKSYRLAVFDEIPRTGLPPSFSGADEFKRALDVLVKSGELEDATKIWWDLRPSGRFPTLEMRITDVCTRSDEAVAIAAVYRCIVRMLYRLRRSNQRWRAYSQFLINENRWLAQRNGTAGNLIDFGRGEPVPYADLADELIDLIADDAAYFGCEREVAHIRTIVHAGTSADRQVKVYRDARDSGADDREALIAVVDHLIAETVAGCGAG